ncbi:MAG: hypothetical protein ACLTBV_20995 [Enterocloster bolteae]
MDGVPHHLIDVWIRREEFNVVHVSGDGKKAAGGDLRSRETFPFMAGGTGFYIQALFIRY